MRKTLLAVSVLALSFSTTAQSYLEIGNTTLTFRKSEYHNDTSIQGSKYLNEQFINTKVNNGTQNFLIRYNAYNDIMEYQNGAELVELIKEQNTHFQFNNGDVYELMTYHVKGKNITRYNQILFDKNHIKISKFRGVELIEAKKAQTGYTNSSPARYVPSKDIYYITLNNKTIEFSGKQKSLEKLFPNKTMEIKKFYKNNKIKENDDDLIKLGKFIMTL